jgi:REP-associated tyrosine transposase
MPYWRLFYHVVWSTKNRDPVLDDATERILTRSIRSTLNALKAIPHAIGYADDHIHIAISIPPSVAVSDAVARMKSASTHAANAAFPGKTFGWQPEYGVLSFGEKALPDVVSYINHQRERHASNQLWPTMEFDSANGQPASAGLSELARGL